MDWTALKSQRSRLPQEYLTVYAMGGPAHTIPIKQGGSVKSLGVHYDTDISGKTQRYLSTQELNGLLAACRQRKATPDTIKAVLESSVIAKIAYRGVLSGSSLKFSLELDRIMAREYRRRTLNMKSSQEEHIFQSARNGGLGFKRLSDVIQKRKKAVVDRLDECPQPVQTAVRAMLHQASVCMSDTRDMHNVEL